MTSARVYKILTAAEWADAKASGAYAGSAVDLRDGFIHLSAEHQAEETARKHFAGQADLVRVAFDPGALGPALKWEPSRGGDLFPHLYGPLPASAAVEAVPMTLNADGVPVIAK